MAKGRNKRYVDSDEESTEDEMMGSEEEDDPFHSQDEDEEERSEDEDGKFIHHPKTTESILKYDGRHSYSTELLKSTITLFTSQQYAMPANEYRYLYRIHGARTVDPLFFEDHDYLYRLAAFQSKSDGNVNHTEANKFLFGPSFTVDKNQKGGKGKRGQKEDTVFQLYQRDPYDEVEVNPTSGSSSASAGESKDDFKCRLCCGLLFEPCTLSCGHSACLSCLQPMFQGNQRKKCPTCKVALKMDPVRDLKVAMDLHRHLQEMFPNDYGKKENEVIKIDLPKVVKIVASQLGLHIDNGAPDKQINSETVLKAVQAEGSDEAMAEYSLMSSELAYSVWKDYTMQHAIHQDTTMAERQRLFDLVFPKAPETAEASPSIPIETYSQLPHHLLTYLLSPQQLDSESKLINFANYIWRVNHFRPQPTGSWTDIKPTSGCPEFKSIFEALESLLPDHLMRQCARRAGVICAEPPLELDHNCKAKAISSYHPMKQMCADMLLGPLLTVVGDAVRVRPHVYSLRDSQKEGSLPDNQVLARTVMVDDVLEAFTNPKVQRNFNCLFHDEIYGFGCLGVPRCLLSPGIISTLHEVISPSCVIDEVALSVVHDMIVTKATDLMAICQRDCQSVTVLAPFDDATSGKSVQYEPVTLEEVSFLEKAVADVAVDGAEVQTAAPAKKKGKKASAATEKAAPTITPEPTFRLEKKAWSSEVYHQLELGSNDGESKGKAGSKRNAAAMNAKTVKLITATNVLQSMEDRFYEEAQADALKAITAFEKYYDCERRSLTITENHAFASHCGLVFSPHLVLFILQHFPMFKEQGALSITIEALVAITASLESLTRFIFKQIQTHCKPTDKVITPRHVFLAVHGDQAFSREFPGIIRNGGVVPRKVLFESKFDDDEMEEELDRFLAEMRRDYGGPLAEDVFIHPFTGGFCCPKLLKNVNNDEIPSTDFVEVPLLKVLAQLTYPPLRSPAEMEDDPEGPSTLHSFTCRKFQAANVLCLKHREKYDRIINSPTALWHLHCKEVAAEQMNSLPIFSPQDIQHIGDYFGQRVQADEWIQRIKLFFSVEACEIIGCIMEAFIIEQYQALSNKSKEPGVIYC